MIDVEIKDLPKLVNWADSLVRVAREGYKQEYILAVDGTRVQFDPPLVILDGPLKEKFLSAAVNHTATFSMLLEENGMGLAMVDDPKCQYGYFYIAILHNHGDSQVCIGVHSDKEAWAAMEAIERPAIWFGIRSLLRKCLRIFRR